MIQTKKGIQLNQAFGAIMVLVLVAVLVIVAILIFVNINNSIATSSSAAITNESATPVTAGVALNGAANCSSGGFVVGIASNATVVIDSANYTVDSTTGVLANLTGEFVDKPWNVTYTYTWGGEACEAGQTMITQFGTYPALVGLVGTIIFLGIVIGVLVASFVFGGRREGV